MLRMLDMSPDDPSNLVPDANSVNARNERDKVAFEAKLAQVNRNIAQRTNGCSMRGFSLLPDPCWSGGMGHLLMMRLDLFPYEDWNLVLLPADEHTARHLDMPPHPNLDVPVFVTASENFLREADARLRQAHAEADRTHNFAAFGDAREAIRNKCAAWQLPS